MVGADKYGESFHKDIVIAFCLIMFKYATNVSNVEISWYISLKEFTETFKGLFYGLFHNKALNKKNSRVTIKLRCH